MRLFGGKHNKSQSSLLTSQPDGLHSLGKSPHQTPNDSPVHSPTYQYPAPSAQAYNEAPEPLGRPSYSHSDEAHPAHTITRSQSQRVGSGSNAYQRPSVNIAEPLVRDSSTIYEYPPPPTEQQQPMRPEKEQKKPKRGFFGIHSSSSKENTPSSQAPPKPLGRTPSILRKPSQGQQDQPSSAPHYPQIRNSIIGYPSQSQEGLELSSENLPIESADDRASPDHEQYYRQLEQKQLAYQKNQFDSPQSQVPVHQSPQYHEDVPPQYNVQQGQYQAFHPPPSRENPDIYIDNQESLSERLSLQPGERPNSRASFGPPSPIFPVQNLPDSRPSTAASNNNNRYSTQAVPAQQQQQQGGMARGDPPPNQGARQQINMQNIPPRQDSTQIETGHDSYSSRQGGPPQVPRSQMLQNEQGRSTPPLSSRNREDPNTADYQTLLAKHEELQAKYSKVKKYYFEKDAQVTQLQNTVANQRLSMSKTSLDDNEYATRFSRLDGAINNLSFNIRKHWKGIPPWLGPFVNRDAHTVGTKEMTAVGRACITRWVVDEILDRYFHPSIEAGLSSQLKIIEKNIRRNAQNSAIQSDEHRDDLTTKLTNWRLTTLEGLQDSINGAQANEYRNVLTQGLSEKLTASLQMNLTDPPPPGLDSGVGMIIELAIGIAANLPIESRDVCIEYFMPGMPIVDAYMKLEPGMPPLVNPAIVTPQNEFNSLGEQGDGESIGSKLSAEDRERERDPAAIEAEIREAAAKGTQTTGQSRSDSVSGVSSKDKKKQSFLGGLVNKKPPPTGGEGGRGAGQAGMVDREAQEKAEREREREREREKEGTIRFAAFVAVEVRGKGGGASGGGNVLVKAPVYAH